MLSAIVIVSLSFTLRAHCAASQSSASVLPPLPIGLLPHPKNASVSLFQSWHGPFVDYETECTGTISDVPGAFVFSYDKLPPEEEWETFKAAAKSLKTRIKSKADVVLLLPSGLTIPQEHLDSPHLRVIEMDFPFQEKDLPPNLAKDLEERNNCCGWAEYFKFNVWRLTQYKSVVFMDADLTIPSNVDFLFTCPYDFMFTSGTASPLNGGFWVLKPSLDTFKQLMDDLLTPGNWDSDTGWFKNGFPCRLTDGIRTFHVLTNYRSKCRPVVEIEGMASSNKKPIHGYEGPQGFLWNFWTLRQPYARSRPLHPCLFNMQRGNLCDTQTFGHSLTVHKGSSNRACPMNYEGCLGVRPLSKGNTWVRRGEAEEHQCVTTFLVTGMGEGTEALVRALGTQRGVRMVKEGSVAEVDVRPDVQGTKGDAVGVYAPLALGRRKLPQYILGQCPRSVESLKIVVSLMDPLLMSARLARLITTAAPTADPWTANLGNHSSATALLTHEIQRFGSVFSPKGRSPYLLKIEDKAANALLDAMHVFHVNFWLRYFPREHFLFVCEEDLIPGAPLREAEVSRVAAFVRATKLPPPARDVGATQSLVGAATAKKLAPAAAQRGKEGGHVEGELRAALYKLHRKYVDVLVYQRRHGLPIPQCSWMEGAAAEKDSAAAAMTVTSSSSKA